MILLSCKETVWYLSPHYHQTVSGPLEGDRHEVQRVPKL
jgi:hypothetical protein